VSRIEQRMGISYRQLDHWSKEGYLLPNATEGSQREWPDQEIRIGRMMARLVAIGISPSRAAYYSRAAIVDRTPMLLEFRNGKLRVRGPFARAVKQHLAEQRRIRDIGKYPEAELDKAV
jgi:DNA-binding transcriptional MerR regulator